MHGLIMQSNIFLYSLQECGTTNPIIVESIQIVTKVKVGRRSWCVQVLSLWVVRWNHYESSPRDRCEHWQILQNVTNGEVNSQILGYHPITTHGNTLMSSLLHIWTPLIPLVHQHNVLLRIGDLKTWIVHRYKSRADCSKTMYSRTSLIRTS